MVQKLTKMQKKNRTVARTLHTAVRNFFLLASFADYLYFYFFICSAALVSSVIASDWKPALVFHMNKLVRENNSFCSWKSGKSQGKCILQSSRNHGIRTGEFTGFVNGLAKSLFYRDGLLKPKQPEFGTKGHECGRGVLGAGFCYPFLTSSGV